MELLSTCIGLNSPAGISLSIYVIIYTSCTLRGDPHKPSYKTGESKKEEQADVAQGSEMKDSKFASRAFRSFQSSPFWS